MSRINLTLLSTIVPLLFASWSLADDSFLYVSESRDNSLGIWRIDGESGSLTKVENYPVGGAAGSQCLHPTLPILYVAIRDKGVIASYRVDTTAGRLQPVNQVDAGGSASYVKTDHEGRYLFSSYYGDGKVGLHRLNEDGSIVEDALQWIETDEKAHAAIIDPSNRFLFVPHTGPNVVYQFIFSAKEGSLKLNQPPTVSGAEGAGPRHLFFNPKSGLFAYGSDELGSGASTYQLDPESGTLTRLQTVSTLPEGFEQRNTTADCEVHPSGKFVYVSNRGHNSIACFRIDDATGKLTRVQLAPTEDTPRSFNIHPNGKFMFAAGQKSNTLATYRIDQTTGKLEKIATQDVGRSPAWVNAVSFAR